LYAFGTPSSDTLANNTLELRARTCLSDDDVAIDL
jgi:hypothetical protein